MIDHVRPETSILIVEDDRVIADGLIRELNAHRCLARLARTGHNALDAARDSPPDAVLLDLGLPDLDRVHICRTLRRAPPTVPIVILTARDAEVEIVVGLDAGATDYITKSFSTQVLLARCERACAARRRARRASWFSVSCASLFTGSRVCGFVGGGVASQGGGRCRSICDAGGSMATACQCLTAGAPRRTVGDKPTGVGRPFLRT